MIVITPGRDEAGIDAAEDARRARQWYCREVLCCGHCAQEFRVEPSDFRVLRGAHWQAEASADESRLWVYCGRCGRRNTYDRGVPSWVVPATGLAILLALLLALYLTRPGGGWQ